MNLRYKLVANDSLVMNVHVGRQRGTESSALYVGISTNIDTFLTQLQWMTNVRFICISNKWKLNAILVIFLLALEQASGMHDCAAAVSGRSNSQVRVSKTLTHLLSSLLLFLRRWHYFFEQNPLWHWTVVHWEIFVCVPNWFNDKRRTQVTGSKLWCY